jgi:hypothetical protein
VVGFYLWTPQTCRLALDRQAYHLQQSLGDPERRPVFNLADLPVKTWDFLLLQRPRQKSKDAYQDAGGHDRRAMRTAHRPICHPRVYLASDTRYTCPSKKQGVKLSLAQWACNIHAMPCHQQGKYRLIYDAEHVSFSFIRLRSLASPVSEALYIHYQLYTRKRSHRDRKRQDTTAGTSKSDHRPWPPQLSKTTRRRRQPTSNRATHGLTTSKMCLLCERAICWISRAWTQS